METPCYDTVILSDLHLGSDLCRAKDAVRMLKATSFRRLILLGDIFCDLNFSRLTKEHWQFLSYIRKLSNPKRNVEVVWVEGNHDHGLSDVMSHLVGVEVYQEYAWESGGQRYLAVHGHQFDRFLVKNFVFSRLMTFLHLQLQKIDFTQKRFSRLIDRVNTAWLRLSPKVASGALAYARLKRADVVFCGHTHEALNAEGDGIRYYNSGCWTTPRATYITVEEQEVQIHEYRRTDDCDSGEERSSADSALVEFPGESGLPADAEYESVCG